ncbi:DUF6342 family protein [Streptomyces sp. f150]|uniref:DUF6342 family protein n=1 Tax=Streptomyces sp. f150 TaxID=1827699 RepID=UPI000BF1A07D|nr:DUF6342 family protein [Streptomyces sp. f150]
MADVDLGLASDWPGKDDHGRVKLVQNRVYPTSPKKDVAVTSPNSVEIELNTIQNSTQEANKVYFTTYHGSQKVILAVLDSNGNLTIAGNLIQGKGGGIRY